MAVEINKANAREKTRAYLLGVGETGRWAGKKISNGNMKIVTRYTKELLFTCEYDGESLGDEFETNDIDKALDWLYEEVAS